MILEGRAKYEEDIEIELPTQDTSKLQDTSRTLPKDENQVSGNSRNLDKVLPHMKITDDTNEVSQDSIDEPDFLIDTSMLAPFDVNLYYDTADLKVTYATATTSVKNLQYEILKSKNEKKRLEIKLAKFLFELHSKFSLAIACFIFLFIGAPMGAIVRKGGFGYPLLISIVFFAIYVIFSIAMKKMSETLKINAILGAWLPTMVIFAIGIFLTIKAKNDSKVMDLDILAKKVLKYLKKTFYRIKETRV